MGKSAKAPDYTAAAQAQAESSREVTEQQTWANRPDQVTPYGSVTWANTPTYDPATGQTLNKWTQNTTLDPKAQAALDSQLSVTQQRSDLAESLTGRMFGEYGPGIDWNSFSSLGATPESQALDSGQKYYDQAGDAVWNQFQSRMGPQFQIQQTQLDQTLRNRGLKPGDQAYDAELAKLRQAQGDQSQTAMNQATTMAGSEASRMFGMDASASGQNFSQDMQSANYQNQIRQQQIAEAAQQRGFTLNEINALLSGAQVSMPNAPSFQGATKSDATNYMGAAQAQYSAAQDAANATNAMWGGLMQGAGAAASMFSDMRMKHSIRRVGTTPGGSRLYAYKYHGGLAERIGVLAQVEALHNPDNVGIAENGMLFVNYAGIK